MAERPGGDLDLFGVYVVTVTLLVVAACIVVILIKTGTL